MLLFRWILLFLLLCAGVSFACFIATGQPHFKQWGWRMLQWAIIAAVLFFSVLILERVA